MKKLLALTLVAGSATALVSACAPRVEMVDVPASATVFGYGRKANASHVGAIMASAVVQDGKIVQMKIDETITYAETLNGDAVLADAPQIIDNKLGESYFEAQIDGVINTVKIHSSYATTDKVCYRFAAEFQEYASRVNLYAATSCATYGGKELTSTQELSFARIYNGFTGTSQMTYTAGNNNALKYEDGTAAGTDRIEITQSTVKRTDSIRENAYKATAYQAGGGSLTQSWIRNITAIESLFNGKNLEEVKQMKEDTGTADVAGSTLQYTNDYFYFARQAAINALSI